MDFRLSLADGFQMLFARERLFLDGLLNGAEGFVGLTYNFLLPAYRAILADWTRQDLAAARMRQDAVMRLYRILGVHGPIETGKAIMALLGMELGPCRPPLRSVEGPDRTALNEALARAGFFELARHRSQSAETGG